MRSHLTRLVFRQLLANEPIAYHGCLRQSRHVCHRATNKHAAVHLLRPQQRTFFNIFRKPERGIKERDVDPGMEKMMELAKMERLGARLPPAQEVVKAFGDYFNHKNKTRNFEPVEDEQAQYLLRAYLYLQRKDCQQQLSSKLLRDKALRILANAPKQPSEAHIRLVHEMYKDLSQRRKETGVEVRRLLYYTIDALSNLRSTAAARDLLVAEWRNLDAAGTTAAEETPDLEKPVSTDKKTLYLAHWMRVMSGFKAEGNAQGMVQTIDQMEKLVLDVRSWRICADMAEYYASTDDLTTAEIWYERSKAADLPSEQQDGTVLELQESLYSSLLQMYLRKQELERGQGVIRDIMNLTSQKRLWDLVFVWAAGTGKGADEINRMMDVMETSNQVKTNASEVHIFDIATINKLVEYAVSRNDPYMAERFIDLGKRRGIQPDAKTLVLQMEYRLSVQDVDGALTAYKHLQGQDLSGNEDVPVVNRLICAMCSSGRHDFESIMNVAADLSDRRARFSPDTVATLSTLHLSRGELHDAIDILNTHAFHYSTSERALIRTSLINFCLRPATSTTQAWDTYTIYRQIFDETDRAERTRIMSDFFRRGRPDMAVHVFNHMRTHTRPDTIPTMDTYISCFAGTARLKDEESLEAVHNQLKLDYSIEPNTRLLNALMLAYTAVDMPRRAIGFWDDIVASREGPSLSSIHLALRACEVSPWGDQKAREIWSRLQRAGVELDQELWGSYVGGLVGNGDVARTIAELEEAQDGKLVEIDSFM